MHSLLIGNQYMYLIYYLYCFGIQNKFNNMFLFIAVLKIICIVKYLSYFKNIIKFKEYSYFSASTENRI